MYGKIFTSMYDGTLRTKWQALVTFQQMIVLCDADGVVDMTVDALSARTGIPLGVISEGVEFLEQPDPFSRSPDCAGKRIERLDQHRPWGWHIVNHGRYRDFTDADTVRAQNRERQRRFRERNASSRTVTVDDASSRHTDTDTDTDKIKNKNPPTPQGGVEGLDLKAWELWNGYKRYRPQYVPIAQRQLAKLGSRQIEAVEHSIGMKYQGLYLPKDTARAREWE